MAAAFPLVLLLLFFGTACSSSMGVENKTPFSLAVPAEKSLEIMEVSGGKDRSDSYYVDRNTFRQMLLNSLKASGRFKEVFLSGSDTKTGDLQLQVVITREDVIQTGGVSYFGVELGANELTAYFDAEYQLRDVKSDSVLWKERISTWHRNYTSEKVNPTEEAMKDNLALLLQKLYNVSVSRAIFSFAETDSAIFTPVRIQRPQRPLF